MTSNFDWNISVRVLCMLMHLILGHVTFLPGEF